MAPARTKIALGLWNKPWPMRSCSPTWRSLCGSCLVRWQRERAAGLAALHIVSVVYGIVAELGPWPCPLTLAENFFEARAGLLPYQGPFVLHYLDAIVYPNLPPALVLTSGVLVCFINLLIYGFRLYRHLAKR